MRRVYLNIAAVVLAIPLAVSLLAQPPAAKGQAVDDAPAASISGTVRDFVTGQPVADASVLARWSAKGRVEGKANPRGEFKLDGIGAGHVRLVASKPRIGPGFPLSVTLPIELAAGQQLEGVDIRLQDHATISGQITDQNGEPAPGTQVYLIAREYQAGGIQYVFAGAASVDDQGRYQLQNVQPGVAFKVMVMKAMELNLPPISNAPLDPALRRPAFEWTFYPGVPNPEGAESFLLRPGEHRENADIEIARTPNYCLEGQATFPSETGEVRFEVMRASPHSGSSGNGGFFTSSPGGTAAAGGRIRVCGLSPGEYRVTAQPKNRQVALSFPEAYSSTIATIQKGDAALVISPTARVTVPVELEWDGQPPADFDPQNFYLRPRPLTRTPMGEPFGVQIRDLPMDIELFVDEYLSVVDNVPPGVYVKDLLYGDTSVLNKVWIPGSETGEAHLKLVLASNGGTVEASVADRDGTALPYRYVTLAPEEIRSEAELADRAVTGQADQRGVWTSPDVAPGKYFVFPTGTPFNRTPDFIDPLWRGRGDAAEVTVSRGGKAKVALEAQP